MKFSNKKQIRKNAATWQYCHKFIWSFIFITTSFSSIYAQLTLRLKSLPIGTPTSDKIYVAGNFNNWNPSDTSKMFKSQKDGSLSLTFTPSVSALEFKLTRGSWATVEGSAQGGFMPNRKLNYSGGSQVEDLTIAGWEGQSNQNSTAAVNVKIISTQFDMPQLGRQRRIWLYLPPDYAKDSTQRYPVFYLHDGQNLFDKATSFSGEWRVDESLNQLATSGDIGSIVVGIDNGGSSRLNEYSPWRNARYGGGEGALYARFLVETLKPYIDANFRTKKDREHTAIGGSSMGGLISMYALMEYQSVFSKALIFSPAFWFALDSSLQHVVQKGKQQPLKVYITAGTKESADMIPDINKMEK
ncbi:MAG: alpha/beta hydrolase [Saprospiraceae bacterium]|nr:alpha/beta hydrolase [Saprospiraceae bacterium]